MLAGILLNLPGPPLTGGTSDKGIRYRYRQSQFDRDRQLEKILKEDEEILAIITAALASGLLDNQ